MIRYFWHYPPLQTMFFPRQSTESTVNSNSQPTLQLIFHTHRFAYTCPYSITGKKNSIQGSVIGYAE